MNSNNMLMCSLSSIAIFISSAFMQSGMSVHDSTALMVMYMSGISSSLLVLWLCLASQYSQYCKEDGHLPTSIVCNE